ncbi:MAG: hypothetical protein IPJ31_16075 [Bacteroidetes bacterium]|nr:hypothetical protein [Bacteroidota bacterium]
MKFTIAPTFLSVLIVLIVGVLTAILFSHSALLSGDMAALHIDSQVYIHTAHQILQGKILYKEVFDHKGPIMYVVNCLGILFCRKTFFGLWLSQWMILVAGLSPLFIFWAKKYNPLLSITALVCMISWIFRTKTIGDNLPEIYAISLIALSYYFALKCFETKNQNRFLSILLGASIMSLFLLKPNLIVLVFPLFLWGFYTLWHSSYRVSDYMIWIKIISIGGGLVLLPFVMYFAYHHALSDALFAFWTFNFSYISTQKRSLIESISQVFFNTPNYFLWFVITAALVKALFTKDVRMVVGILLLSVVLSIVVLVGIPGRGSESYHYAIPLAPLLAWLLITIGTSFQKWQLYVLFAIALFFFRPVWLHFVSDKPYPSLESAAIQFINTHKKPLETLCVLGNRSAAYEQTGLTCNTSFFYTYPILENCGSTINETFLKQFADQKADWVLFEMQYPMKNCVINILRNYKQVYATDKEQVFQLQ